MDRSNQIGTLVLILFFIIAFICSGLWVHAQYQLEHNGTSVIAHADKYFIWNPKDPVSEKDVKYHFVVNGVTYSGTKSISDTNYGLKPSSFIIKYPTHNPNGERYISISDSGGYIIVGAFSFTCLIMAIASFFIYILTRRYKSGSINTRSCICGVNKKAKSEVDFGQLYITFFLLYIVILYCIMCIGFLQIGDSLLVNGHISHYDILFIVILATDLTYYSRYVVPWKLKKHSLKCALRYGAIKMRWHYVYFSSSF